MARLVIAVVALLVAGVVGALVLRARSLGRPQIMPYGELRRQMIAGGGSAAPLRGRPPERPAGLDARLPMAHCEALRSAMAAGRGLQEYFNVITSIFDELREIDSEQFWYELLSPGRRAVLLLDRLESEVNNGGFDQYYLNTSGDGAALAPEGLRFLGLDELAELVERANAKFAGGVPQDRGVRMAAMEGLDGAWNDLDEEFLGMETPYGGWGQNVGSRYVLEHPEEFFADR